MTCLKCTILATNLQKSPIAGCFPPPAPLNLQYWWPKVPWFGQIVFFVFEGDYNEIEFQNIVLTSFQWHHHNYVTENDTKITSQKLFQFGSLSIKISGYVSAYLLVTISPVVTRIECCRLLSLLIASCSTICILHNCILWQWYEVCKILIMSLFTTSCPQNILIGCLQVTTLSCDQYKIYSISI